MWFCKKHVHITTQHGKLSAKQAIIQQLLTRPREVPKEGIHVN